MVSNTGVQKKLLLFLFFLLPFGIYAQKTYSSNPSIFLNFTLGYTNSNIYNDTIKYDGGNYGNAGVGLIVVTSSKTNIGIEALFLVKALRVTNPYTKYYFGTIDIPLYLQYKWSETIRANIGLNYSKIIYANVEYLDGRKKSGVNQFPLTTKLDNDVSVLIGGEINLAKNLILGARYSISTKIFFPKNSAYFGIFQLSFNYTFYKNYRQFKK